MLKDLDVPTTEVQSPIRFYKLKNTKAADVLATIASLYGDSAHRNRGGGAAARRRQRHPALPEQRRTGNHPPLRRR